MAIDRLGSLGITTKKSEVLSLVNVMLVLVFVFLFVSCGNASNKMGKNAEYLFDLSFEGQTSLNIFTNKIFGDKQMIALETPENCLIGNSPELLIDTDDSFVQDQMQKQETNINYNKKSTYILRSVGSKQIQQSGIWFQYLEWNNGKYLVCSGDSSSDANVIYWIDYQTGEVIQKMTIPETIPLPGFAIFFVLSPDSILVLDDNQFCTLYLLDAQGSIRSQFPLGQNQGSFIGTEQEPYRNGKELLLSGFVVANRAEETTKPGIIFPCYSYNMATNVYQPVPAIDYPSDYYCYNWGGENMREVYATACYPLNGILYSFPISHSIYVYDVKMKKMKKYDGGSSFVEKIPSYSSEKKFNSIESGNYRKYFFGQPSYYKVLYDPHRSLYYRLVGLPSEKFDINDMKTYRKKLSVIILDKNFQFLGETLLDEQYNPRSAFVNEKGLHIVFAERKAGSITWHIFEPKKNNP